MKNNATFSMSGEPIFVLLRLTGLCAPNLSAHFLSANHRWIVQTNQQKS
ncbi:hypothetical protein [[Pseudopropionibacterium] massiliense]|nr:hypothetical protein [[Pseudopropionibacterium] massiliense]